MKTDGYILQLIWGPLAGLILAGFNYYKPLLLGCEQAHEIISKTTDISFIIFGFLLTILALIMQSESGIKKSALYTRLVKLNRKVVFLSLVLGFYSLILVSQFSKHDDSFPHDSLLTIIFFFIVGWFLLESIFYLSVFYKLVLNQKV